MNKEALFSSAKADWETPPAFFEALDAEFHFDLDVCATEANAKCDLYISPEENALVTPWAGRCWMNPPYGREISKWVRRAYEQVHLDREASLVVCLLPARTDTAWWHDYVMRASEARFVRGRLKFVGAAASAPFPSTVVVFRHGGQDTLFRSWRLK